MTNGHYTISPENWERLSTDEKLWIIYDTHNQTQIACKECRKECMSKFKALENGRLVNTGIAASSGFIGGFVAVVTKKFFGF